MPIKRPPQKNNLLNNNIYGIIIALVIIISALAFNSSNKKHPPVNPPQFTAINSNQTLAPQVFNAGIDKIYSSQPLEAQFTIHTRNEDAYLKFLDKNTQQTILTIKAPKNFVTEVKVPLGEFIIKVATGIEWYGENDLFGPGTTFKQFQQVMNFYKTVEQIPNGGTRTSIQGHQIYLEETVNGNLHSQPLSRQDF